MNGDIVESVSFNIEDDKGVPLDKSDGFTEFMSAYQPNYFTRPYGNININSILVGGKNTRSQLPAFKVVFQYTGK